MWVPESEQRTRLTGARVARARGLTRARGPRVAALVGLTAALWCARAPLAVAGGIDVFVTDSLGTTQFPTVQDEFSSNDDVNEVTTFLSPAGVVATGTVGGVSAKAIAELVGVAPASITEMTVTDDSPAYSFTLTEPEVALGFDSAAAGGYLASGESSPQQATFRVGTEGQPPGQPPSDDQAYFARPQTSATDVNGAVIDGAGWTYVSPGGDPDMQVTVVVPGAVIDGVPTPNCSPCSVGVGDTVTFTEPAGSLTLGPNPDTAAFYTWDFGDGSPTVTSPAADPTMTHVYTARGPYQVRVTVTDAQGNEGVSPNAQLVTVLPKPLATNGNAGNGGASKSGSGGSGGPAQTGGGAGGPKALASGAAAGSTAAPTPSAAPRTAGPAPTSSSAKAPDSRGEGGSGAGGKGRGEAGGSGRAGSAGAGTGTGSGGTGGQGGHGAGGASGIASATSPQGAGTARTAPPRPPVALGAPVAAQLTGFLVDSTGGPLGGTSAAAASDSNPLSLLQSIARESEGSGGGSPGLPSWLIGILALLGFLACGVVREWAPRGHANVVRTGAP
jgi:PKD domain